MLLSYPLFHLSSYEWCVSLQLVSTKYKHMSMWGVCMTLSMYKQQVYVQHPNLYIYVKQLRVLVWFIQYTVFVGHVLFSVIQSVFKGFIWLVCERISTSYFKHYTRIVYTDYYVGNLFAYLCAWKLYQNVIYHVEQRAFSHFFFRYIRFDTKHLHLQCMFLFPFYGFFSEQRKSKCLWVCARAWNRVYHFRLFSSNEHPMPPSLSFTWRSRRFIICLLLAISFIFLLHISWTQRAQRNRRKSESKRYQVKSDCAYICFAPEVDGDSFSSCQLDHKNTK